MYTLATGLDPCCLTKLSCTFQLAHATVKVMGVPIFIIINITIFGFYRTFLKEVCGTQVYRSLVITHSKGSV